MWVNSVLHFFSPERSKRKILNIFLSCILIPAAICLVFFGEYNYVKDLDNIYHIKKDIVDITDYDPANDGKPVAYYAEAKAPSFQETTWGFTVPESFGVSWSGQIYRYTEGTTDKDTKKQNPPTGGWSSTSGTRFTYNSVEYNKYSWSSPCGGTSCSGSVTNPSKFTMGNFTGTAYLESDYMSRTSSKALDTSKYYANW